MGEDRVCEIDMGECNQQTKVHQTLKTIKTINKHNITRHKMFKTVATHRTKRAFGWTVITSNRVYKEAV